MAHDVIISYASTDKSIADQVCSALETVGARCWIAPRDLQPGKAYGGVITEAIQASRIMVVIFSADSNRSNQVVREVERAVHNKITIIPLRVEDIKPTGDMEYFLSMPQWLDATDEPRDHALQHLARTVLSILDPDDLPTPPSSKKDAPRQ